MPWEFEYLFLGALNSFIPVTMHYIFIHALNNITLNSSFMMFMTKTLLFVL